MSHETTRGMRDTAGADAELAARLKERVTGTFRRFGYEPLETTIVENAETLVSNGGEEIRKEIFAVTDGAERDLALRFDLTVPLARYVASEPHLPLPFKRYEIGPVFRDGPISVAQGRYRKFTQMDADIVGGERYLTDLETLALGGELLRDLDLGAARIRLNDRGVLNGILRHAGVPDALAQGAILTIDKIDKIGLDGITTELSEKGLDARSIDTIVELIDTKETNDATIARLANSLDDERSATAIAYLDRLARTLEAAGTRIELRPDLARGLSYYTGITFEIFTEGFASAIGAGGRYDEMIGSFAQTNREYPAVGISFGLERLASLMPAYETREGVYLIALSDATDSALDVASRIRASGTNVFVGSGHDRLVEAFVDAEKRGYTHAAILGGRELEDGTVGLRDLRHRTQQHVPIEDVAKRLTTK